jgi:hypothetical protein
MRDNVNEIRNLIGIEKPHRRKKTSLVDKLGKFGSVSKKLGADFNGINHNRNKSMSPTANNIMLAF